MASVNGPPEPCPCTSDRAMSACCGPVLADPRAAPTAERLMRSRFTAFATGNVAHLLATWHPSTRPRTLDLDDGRVWTSLDVLSTTAGGPFHTEGTVRFAADLRDGRRSGRLTEISTFTRVDGRWVYVDGT
ncbi:YchJ family metal-binding protein [Rhodococcus kroppenstedtii]|uniref:YchJ family protein n=1 Tax=Rhodococcoides kroppenstedtii TaxID=293050 RepID=UPI0029547FE5|nr:YchJ family metal-binding protein [Rhodococcus kroppenstedtii]MDV7199341.1 YchJ family metal-binding protein [Rhodococcus kroppenstedtii]